MGCPDIGDVGGVVGASIGGWALSSCTVVGAEAGCAADEFLITGNGDVRKRVLIGMGAAVGGTVCATVTGEMGLGAGAGIGTVRVTGFAVSGGTALTIGALTTGALMFCKTALAIFTPLRETLPKLLRQQPGRQLSS